MIYATLVVIAYLAFMAGRIVEKQAQIGKNQKMLKSLESVETGGSFYVPQVHKSVKPRPTEWQEMNAEFGNV